LIDFGVIVYENLLKQDQSFFPEVIKPIYYSFSNFLEEDDASIYVGLSALDKSKR